MKVLFLFWQQHFIGADTTDQTRKQNAKANYLFHNFTPHRSLKIDGSLPKVLSTFATKTQSDFSALSLNSIPEFILDAALCNDVMHDIAGDISQSEVATVEPER